MIMLICMYIYRIGNARDFWFKVLSYWPDTSLVHEYIGWLTKKVIVPDDYDRMMLKAQQRLSKLTAKEWITWCLILSQPIMRQLPIPTQLGKQVRQRFCLFHMMS